MGLGLLGLFLGNSRVRLCVANDLLDKFIT